MIDMKNLNKETKVFFLSLFCLFLLDILLINENPFFFSIPLGFTMGAVIGFLYLYGIGRLEIHEKRERYRWKSTDTLLSKNICIKIKGYLIILFGAAFISILGWLMKEKGIIESYLGVFTPLWAMFGATITFLYFSSVGRLKIYKEKSLNTN